MMAVDMGAFEYDGPLVRRSYSSFTLEVDESVGNPSRLVYIGSLFQSADTFVVEFATADVASAVPEGIDDYRFTGIGEDGESTEVSLFAVDAVTGDRARVVFTISKQDTYAVEDFRVDNGMDAGGADDGADFSGNGVSNLAQYISGESDAYVSVIADADYATQQIGLPKYEFDTNADQLTITYVEPIDEGYAGIDNDSRESPDLDSWGTVDTGGEGGPQIRSVDTGEGYRIYEVIIAMDEDQRFYRLEAETGRSVGEM